MAAVSGQRVRYPYGRVPGSRDYDGSAARRLREEPLRRPREETRRQAITRPKAEVREAGAVSVFAVVGFAAVALFAVLLIASYVQLARLSDEVVQLQSEVVTLQGEGARLQTRYAMAYDPSEVEHAMIASGTMVRPTESQICYVDLSEEDTVEIISGDRPEKGVQGALESLREIVDTVVEYFR